MALCNELGPRGERERRGIAAQQHRMVRHAERVRRCGHGAVPWLKNRGLWGIVDALHVGVVLKCMAWGKRRRHTWPRWRSPCRGMSFRDAFECAERGVTVCGDHGRWCCWETLDHRRHSGAMKLGNTFNGSWRRRRRLGKR